VNKPVSESDVLVVGGGLHGSSSAFHMARRGARVTVLEADYVGRHSSGVNAGGVRTLGRPLPEIPLSLMSREIWHTLADTIGDDGGFVPSGQMKIAETEAELDECRERVALLESHAARTGTEHRAARDGRNLGRARRLCAALPDHGIVPARRAKAWRGVP
jgi:sarcosine oxidase subunit beta